jgi:hypothetical protein
MMIKAECTEDEVARKRHRIDDNCEEVQEEVEKKKEPKEEQQAVIVEYPNSPGNVKDFGWCKHGDTKVRKEKRRDKKQPNEQAFLKEYFICSEKKKAGGTCGAKKRIHHLPGGDIMECVGSHNHPPPEKVKTDPDIQKKIEDYSKVGAKATVIQARLMKEASENNQPISRKNVPTKQHIYNTQHRMLMEQLPTSTRIVNITFSRSSFAYFC